MLDRNPLLVSSCDLSPFLSFLEFERQCSMSWPATAPETEMEWIRIISSNLESIQAWKTQRRTWL